MYLVNTRPDICFAVSTLGQFMCESRQMHWVVAKHVLRYLCGIVGYGLRYNSNSDLTLVSYSDSDWVGSVDDRRVLPDVASTWGLPWFPGLVGNSPQLL